MNQLIILWAGGILHIIAVVNLLHGSHVRALYNEERVYILVGSIEEVTRHYEGATGNNVQESAIALQQAPENHNAYQHVGLMSVDQSGECFSLFVLDDNISWAVENRHHQQQRFVLNTYDIAMYSKAISRFSFHTEYRASSAGFIISIQLP